MKHQPIGKRRPVNLTLDSDTVAAARELGINLSQACNEALTAAVKEQRALRWKEENREAMEAWNRWLDMNGLPYADERLF